MMDDFLKLAVENTRKNLETCGVLAGSLVSAVKIEFYCHFVDVLIAANDSFWCLQSMGL